MMAKKATPTICAGPLSTISRRLKARSCAADRLLTDLAEGSLNRQAA
jgi:hypothetical protein